MQTPQRYLDAWMTRQDGMTVATMIELLIREWNREHGAEQQVASLDLVKFDASRADEPLSTLPREVLWPVGRRPPSCGI